MIETSTIQIELNRKGRIILPNRGTSMLPLLHEGRDLMIVEKIHEHILKKYDVVLYKRSNGQYVLHRILKICEDEYWLVGDNCVAGEYIKEEQIIGILIEVVHNGKRFTVDNRFYRIYVFLWCTFYPVRFGILKCKWFVQRNMRRVRQ